MELVQEHGVGPGSVAHWRTRLLEEINFDDLVELSLAQRRARLEKVTGHLIAREGPVLSARERAALIRRVVDEALGLGVLEPLLADPSVSEIMVNGLNEIYFRRVGRLERLDAGFSSETELYQVIDRIVAQVNRRVDESSPLLDARLPTGERVTVTVPPLSRAGPTLTIRRFARLASVNELAARGTLDQATVMLLAAFVRARMNIMVAGNAGSGKTTFMNALSAFIPDRERIVTVEDSAELQLPHDHVISLEARPPNVEGRGEVSVRTLVQHALKMGADRLVVGEAKDAETLDLLKAISTGCRGSMFTIHADSTEDSVSGLETLARLADSSGSPETIRRVLARSIDVIVFMQRGANGGYHVQEISVNAQRSADHLVHVPVMERLDSGAPVYHPLPETFRSRMAQGRDIVPAVFGQASAPGTVEEAPTTS
ncbi:CpaF family protein [Spirillospora sp. CA-294931]|uniref:CpaF family protein n=1 Tax=Spirillospora sp. CA-294931 TaxID=3240042 RepID=UPI003D8FF826